MPARGAPETIEHLSERYGPAYRWFVVATCLMGALGMVLSSVSMNVAVPSVMGAFGVGQDQAQWIATGYLASMVIGMLLHSWLIAALGQRLTFMVIIGAFLAASVVGAFSTSIEMLIAARIMQGIPAGVIQPFAMMMNFQVFPPERRGTAMGMFGMGVVLAPVFGPLLGGIAIDTLGWRYIFAMPLPLIAVAAILGPVFLPERVNRGPLPHFDWTGLVLLAVGLAFSLSALTSGQRLGWTSDDVVGMGALGIAAITTFVWWEGKAKRPLLDFTLFLNPRFACAMAVSFIFGICLFGSAYVIPVFTQIIQGYTAMRAGGLIALGGSIMVLMFPISGRVADSMPPQYLIVGGLVIFSAGFVMMHYVDVNTGFFVMAALAAFTRLGLSWVMTPLNTTALRYVPPEKLASGSSNANFFRQLGGGMGIAILVAILETRTTFHANNLTATQTPANTASGETLWQLSELLAVTGLPEAMRQAEATVFLGRIVQANAAMFGFQDVFLTLAGITMVAVLPAWFLRRPRPVMQSVNDAIEEPAKKAVPLPKEPAHPARVLHRRFANRTAEKTGAASAATRRQAR